MIIKRNLQFFQRKFQENNNNWPSSSTFLYKTFKVIKMVSKNNQMNRENNRELKKKNRVKIMKLIKNPSILLKIFTRWRWKHPQEGNLLSLIMKNLLDLRTPITSIWKNTAEMGLFRINIMGQWITKTQVFLTDLHQIRTFIKIWEMEISRYPMVMHK